MNFLPRFAVLVLCFQLVFAGSSGASGAPRKVSPEEAHLLVETISASYGWTKLPGFGLEEYTDSYFPEFYFFDATWDNLKGSVNLDHFAVDVLTGDVWNAVVCREYSSKKLKAVQKAIREKMGLTDKQYRHIRRRGPMC